MRLKAPSTPKDRAMPWGTPIFGKPYLSGLYANDVHGDANALCHVSDLFVISKTSGDMKSLEYLTRIQ